MSAICGMTGNHARRPDAERALGAMLELLTARAPDDASTWRDPDGAALLGFRWLKTQPDEQSPGIQHSEGRLAMTCDGHVFDGKGQGVSELLARFARSGADAWRGLDAQFALAIWDRTRAKLSLARDPLGARFLYYFSSPDGVIFSSELKSLLQHPAVPRRFDEVGVAHYLTFLNVPGPERCSTRFAESRQVRSWRSPPAASSTSAASGTFSMRPSTSGTTRTTTSRKHARSTKRPSVVAASPGRSARCSRGATTRAQM
ncbi:Asparagine synthetase [Labilithrix luteola]|uniref:asparagine synthase (glutamine-hydrolyzing) n=1 Tax=Labilithrix luteola TaxID=1391654 RepID=A0A0K1PY20_9BACT|nr:Asparagine synthetase [Labilithrix luteola]